MARFWAATRRISSTRARRPGSRSAPSTIIREYSTINRGTAATFKTTVGARCFIMTYVHLAHDCHVGDDVVIANATQCAGHVTIHDRAILSGLNAVHQFVTIGTYAFVGGGSRVNQDIPPYVKAVGNPMELYGLNSIGLQRAGFSGRDDGRTQAGVPALLQLRPQSVPGAGAGPQPICRRFPRSSGSWHSSSRASEAFPREGAAAGRRHRRGRAGAAPRPASGPARATCSLVGVCDIGRRPSGRRSPAELGTAAFPSWTTCSARVEAVTVAVPTPAHAEVGLRALSRACRC